MFLSSLFSEPGYFFRTLVIVIVSVTLHELGHALVATWEGDPTPARRGHLTWNPLVHMGWQSLAAVALVGIAWGLTPVTPAYFRHRRWGETLVSFAGPFVNLLLALLAAVTLVVAIRLEASDALLGFWNHAVRLNVLLFLFNLIPLPPLDGFHVLESSVKLGEIGPMLRRAGWWPLVIAALIASRPEFQHFARAVATSLVRGVGRVL